MSADREEIRERMARTRRRVIYCPAAGMDDVECEYYELAGSPTAVSDMVEHVNDEHDGEWEGEDWPDATDHGVEAANPHESDDGGEDDE